MDSVVLDVLPVEAALVSEVLLKLLLDVVCDRPPAAKGFQMCTNWVSHKEKCDFSKYFTDIFCL